jgi:hypothetical protein
MGIRSDRLGPRRVEAKKPQHTLQSAAVLSYAAKRKTLDITFFALGFGVRPRLRVSQASPPSLLDPSIAPVAAGAFGFLILSLLEPEPHIIRCPSLEEAMADNRKKRGRADRSRIDVNQAYELQYWKEMFGVSGRQLAEAVREVGPTVKKVAAYLKEKDKTQTSRRRRAPRRTTPKSSRTNRYEAY